MRCEMQYCEFICLTPFSMHTERILPQLTLFLDEIKPALDTFFVGIKLPMLLTGQTQYTERGGLSTSDSSDCTTFCWYGGKEGNMVACDNPMCETESFHFECAGLKRKPGGKRFCSEACECKCNTES